MKISLKNIYTTLSHILLLFILLLVLINPSGAESVNEIILNPEAQDSKQVDKPPVIEDSPELKIDFKQNTQDPETKKVKFEITVTSNFTSDRVRIDWKVSGASKPVNESELTITRTTIRNGVPQTYSIEVIPTRVGISEVFAKVTAVKVDGNVISTVRKNYVSNNNQEVLPIPDEYRQKQLINLIIKIIIYLAIGVVILFLGFFGLILFKRWLNKYDKNIST